MKTHKKLKARILSLALSAVMVTTMLPMTVFATEGGGTPPGESDLGVIQSFDKLEGDGLVADGKSKYSLAVDLDTALEDLALPDELTALVARTTTVTAPAEDNVPDGNEDIVDSGTVDQPTGDEVIPDEDQPADDTVSGNNPASPSDADEKEEIKDEDVPLAATPKQKETTVTTIESEAIAVTWESDKDYSADKAGSFKFTPVLDGDYTLADGVKLPTITVTVGGKMMTLADTYTLSGTVSCDYEMTDTITFMLGSSGNYEKSYSSMPSSYSISDIPAGTSGKLYITGNDGLSLYTSPDDIIISGDTTRNITLESPTISGTIKGSDTNAGIAATLQLKDTDGAVGAPVTAAADGTYTISDVQPNSLGTSYTIDVSMDGYTAGTIDASSVAYTNITGKDLTLTKAAGKPQRTKSLDFTSNSIKKQEDDTSWGDPTSEDIDALTAEGWKWELSTKTLTLDGLNLLVNASVGIRVPDGTVIELIGENIISNSLSYSIWGNGSLVIENASNETGRLSVTDTKADAVHTVGNLTINSGNMSFHCAGNGLYSNTSVFITGGTVAIRAGRIGIYGPNCTFSGDSTIIKVYGTSMAISFSPICEDGIVATGGQSTSAGVEVTWKKAASDYDYEINLANVTDSTDKSKGYTKASGVLTLTGTAGKTYRLYGDGGSNVTTVNVDVAANITLDNVTVHCQLTNVALNLNANTTIILAEGSVNSLRSDRSQGIFADFALEIQGSGALTVEGGRAAAIYSLSDVKISGGTVTAKTANGTAIKIGIGNEIIFSGENTVVKAEGSEKALSDNPTCNDGIVARGGTWESADTEVTWQKDTAAPSTYDYEINLATAGSGAGYTLSDGRLTLTGAAGKTYRLYGAGGSNVIFIFVNDATDITLDGVKLMDDAAGVALFKLNTTLRLKGTNVIQTGAPAIQGNGLFIVDSGNEDGVLNLTMSGADVTAGILVGNGPLTITGVTVHSTGGTFGIVGKSVTITDATVNALSSGDRNAAAIDSGTTVNIINSRVSATTRNGYGIKSRSSITFEGADTVVKAKGGTMATNMAPVLKDNLAASGGTWNSPNTEVTWQKSVPSGGGTPGGGGGSSSSVTWTSVPTGYQGGTKIINSVRVPDYTVEGTWRQDASGVWSFSDTTGKGYANGWAPVFNPYANRNKGQNAFDWFFFDANGHMLTGWYTDADGNRYYLNPNSDNTLGAMRTGWVFIDEKYYYFNERPDGTRGKLYRNTTTPDGYAVDANGVWDGKGKQ